MTRAETTGEDERPYAMCLLSLSEILRSLCLLECAFVVVCCGVCCCLLLSGLLTICLLCWECAALL